MKRHKIRAHRGYKQPGVRYTKPTVAAPNRLRQQFGMDRPDRAWVTDITYIYFGPTKGGCTWRG